MRQIIFVIVLLMMLPVSVSAMDYTAPTVPENVEIYMPDQTETFSDGLLEILSNALNQLDPAIMEAIEICGKLLAVALLISMVRHIHSSTAKLVECAGSLSVAVLVFASSDSLIRLAGSTVEQLSDYGKLLIPVMTAALAAQGGVTTSAALYTGTVLFDSVLSALIAVIIVPLQYLCLGLAVAEAAMGEDVLKKLGDLIKWLSTWLLKNLLYIFTGYIGLTGVISGATDAAAMKVTKMTISNVVPVVGGILSDATEAVLVGTGVMKNAAGIYGILAVIAIFIGPFMKIGVHYLMLKLTSAITSVYAPKKIAELIGRLSTVMGMLLGMTGAVCLMLLISTVCYLKGVG